MYLFFFSIISHFELKVPTNSQRFIYADCGLIDYFCNSGKKLSDNIKPHNIKLANNLKRCSENLQIGTMILLYLLILLFDMLTSY